MKAIKRLPYVEVTKEIRWSVCCFCRYGESNGSACDGSEIECCHPLADRVGHPAYDILPEEGEDCWAFRPEYPLEDIADMVGLILANNFDPYMTTYEEVMYSGERRISKVIGTQKEMPNG